MCFSFLFMSEITLTVWGRRDARTSLRNPVGSEESSVPGIWAVGLGVGTGTRVGMEAPVASTQFGSPKNHTNAMVAHKGTFCKTLTTPGVLRGRESSALRGPGYPNRCPSLPRPRRDNHAPPPQSYATPTPTRSRVRWPRPILT